MSITIQHLNADTTFLLRIWPPEQLPPSSTSISPLDTTTVTNYYNTNSITDVGGNNHENAREQDTIQSRRPQPLYSILIDPWLSGPAIIGYSWFVRSEHNIPSFVSHLSEIGEPDLVIVSQNKPDHCHEATLRQLLADDDNRNCNHNNINGITGSSMKMSSNHKYHNDKRKKEKNTTKLKSWIVAEPKASKTIRTYNHFDPSRIIKMPKYDRDDPSSVLRFPVGSLDQEAQGEVTVAFIPARNYRWNGLHNAIGITYTFRHRAQPSLPPATANIMTDTVGATSPETLSILYSPHGIPIQPDLQPYLTGYLEPLAALPLTLLLHSFHRVDNPWYLGGNICAGASGGGVELARGLRARYWVGAHDEEKHDRGLGTRLVRKEKLDAEAVERALAALDSDGDPNRSIAGDDGQWWCSVRSLSVGEELVVPLGVLSR